MTLRRRQDQEDRDRLIRIEMGLEFLDADIKEHVIKRLDNHSGRIQRMERIFLIGSGIVIAVKAGWSFLTRSVK